MTYRRSSAPRRTSTSLWMELRYAGKCKVCATTVPAGARAFYDVDARSITCTNLECASADGLTKQEWTGSPMSGRWVEVLSPYRIGNGVPAS